MSLKALLKANRKQEAQTEPSIIFAIDAHLIATPMSEDRRDGKFHPSDLVKNFCPRAWWLYNHHPDGYRVKEGDITPRLQRIYGNGHGVHHRLQGYLADMGVLWGAWRKPGRKTAVYGTRPGPEWHYGEVTLMHKGDNILGSTDGILMMDGRVVLEIKSINPDGFRFVGAQGARQEHIDQVRLYFHCLEAWPGMKFRKGFDREPLKGALLVYECKGTQDLKEFFIPYVPAQVEAFVETLRPRMREALAAKDTPPACHCPEGKVSKLCAKLVP